MNTVICAIAKNENNYINEWANYYLALGFNHIYLYDNNDKNTPYVGDFLDGAIKNKVTIINKQGLHEQGLQWKVYQEFYNNYNKSFDWCLFCDIDEFLTGIDNINNFLSQEKFKNIEQIRIRWKLFGDDDIIERDISQPVFGTFKKEITNNKLSAQGKAIIHGHLQNIFIKSCHYAFRSFDAGKTRKELLSCLPSGKPSKNSTYEIKDDYSAETIFINHYMTKSLTEFINQKLNRSDAVFATRTINLNYFWQINTITPEKLNYLKANALGPKISIIVPIYNVEKYLNKCLTSIQNQNETDFECILVNDCSPDNCEKICKEFCNKDTRFIYIKHDKNKGVGKARNTGLDRATGKFISFIDSDDYIEPNFYTVLLPYADKYGWVRTNANGVNEQGKTVRNYPLADGLFTANMPGKLLSSDRAYDLSTTCICLYKNTTIGNLRFETCPYGEDYIFSLKLFATFGQVYFKKTGLYNYLIRPGSASSSQTVNKFQLITFLNHFNKMLREIKDSPYYNILKPIYIDNFENRAYLKELCHEGIDFVFPFVDSTDITWQQQYLKAKGQDAINKEVNGLNRFRPNEYLKYLFRGIEKNLPWINKIHLIVASESQVPSWIDRNKVHIVLHEDIIPKKLLPTFNSSTIEMFYSNIVGLSNRFLYANDDMFILKPCSKEDFFNGLIPKIKMMKVNNVTTNEIWRVTFQNSFKLGANIKELPGYYMAPEHTIAPYIKKSMQEVYTKYYQKIYDSCTQFRNFNNLNIYCFADYMWAAKKIEPSKLSFKYIWTGCAADTIKEDFKSAAIICINDTELLQDQVAINLIKQLFEKQFNEKSIYEIGCNRIQANYPELFRLPQKETSLNATTNTNTQKKDIRADGRPGSYLYF